MSELAPLGNVSAVGAVSNLSFVLNIFTGLLASLISARAYMSPFEAIASSVLKPDSIVCFLVNAVPSSLETKMVPPPSPLQFAVVENHSLLVSGSISKSIG